MSESILKRMNIVFLLSDISSRYCLKRVNLLEHLGIQAQVLGFDRGYYSGIQYHGETIFLGDLKEKHYFNRIFRFFYSLPKVYRSIKTTDVLYAFGQDLLGLGWIATLLIKKKPKIVCEIADIQPALTDCGLYSRILRFIERILLIKVDLLVVTSEAFVTGYFQDIQGITEIPYQVIENKVDEESFFSSKAIEVNDEKSDVLRIGYFGLLRCRRSWEILRLAAVKGGGRITIYLRGIIPWDDMRKEMWNSPNVVYAGAYVSPDELSEIYGQVDMVWAGFPYEGQKSGNWCWARTNRFYESCFFKKPMFVQKGTEDSRVVDNLGLGLSLDLENIDICVDQILKMGPVELTQWKHNISQLPKKIYTYSDEHNKLIEALSR
jgi:succinoglycan biosynthesis protein ExoL